MKKIIILLSALFYVFTVPVFASEEDILKEPVKEEEEDIKEEDVLKDDNLLKGTGNINNTKATVSDPMQALCFVGGVHYLYSGNEVTSQYTVNVSSITIGYYYRIRFHNGDYFDFIYPKTGYLKRGYESIDNTISELPYANIDRFINNNNSSSNYVEIIDVSDIEPTPEPTQTPDPEEPEEPEVDPETISGNEILREMLRTNREINENVKGIYKYISDNSVSDSVLSDNSVSDNIIYKRLEDYSTSESLALIGLVLAFGALVIYLIHKTVFKIRR